MDSILGISRITLYISAILPFLFLINVRKANPAYISFLAYLICMALIQVMSRVLVLKGEHNIFLIHYMLFMQFITLSLFFYFILKKRWVLYLSGSILILFVVQYLFFIKVENSYNPLGLAVCGLIITFYAGRYLYSLINKKGKYLYITLGSLIYFSLSIMVFGLGNVGLEIKKSVIDLLFYFNAYGYLIFQVLCIINWYIFLRDRNKQGIMT
tara:strand:- start:785 stop:1420 length:636 start_codon:yes stop_codon:yes gene_type:complete